MIRNTFSILNGIGERLEKRLWRSGILTWNDFINIETIDFLPVNKKMHFNNLLSSAIQELDLMNSKYFAAMIKRREHWRLLDIFRSEAVCLDIETNGFIPGSGGYVTVVGLYDGYDYQCFVRGINLTPYNIMKALAPYKYLITYYGTVFDVPFMQRAMPDLKFDIPHFDICFGSRKLGFKGGLKKLENILGIKRDDSVKGMDGYDAVKLWEYAQEGSLEAIEHLKIYNREDTVNLFKIAHIIYKGLRSQTGIDEYLYSRSSR